jgi:GTP-binding protein
MAYPGIPGNRSGDEFEMKILSAEFVLSAKEPAHYPPAVFPEIAFAGRSNVGKSSLINTLLNRKKLARTSNTPGRTQEINFFRVNDRFAFIDLPGYGYAKVPESIRKQWGPMVETYLRERDTLRLVVLILDVRRDPSEEDLQLIHWLPFYQIPFRIVLTKTDKVSNNEFADRRRRIVEKIGFSPETPLVVFSAKTGAGKESLWREIRKAVGADAGLNI